LKIPVHPHFDHIRAIGPAALLLNTSGNVSYFEGNARRPMKNILVVDSAGNCSYSVCLIDDVDFEIVFPRRGQDVEFVEDLVERVGEKIASGIVKRGTTRRIRKTEAVGIHGTLFFGLLDNRKYFPNKREDDVEAQNFHTGDGFIDGRSVAPETQTKRPH
jgi:hypothetical protein